MKLYLADEMDWLGNQEIVGIPKVGHLISKNHPWFYWWVVVDDAAITVYLMTDYDESDNPPTWRMEIGERALAERIVLETFTIINIHQILKSFKFERID